jgi:hypothetical protein
MKKAKPSTAPKQGAGKPIKTPRPATQKGQRPSMAKATQRR